MDYCFASISVWLDFFFTLELMQNYVTLQIEIYEYEYKLMLVKRPHRWLAGVRTLLGPMDKYKAYHRTTKNTLIC